MMVRGVMMASSRIDITNREIEKLAEKAASIIARRDDKSRSFSLKYKDRLDLEEVRSAFSVKLENLEDIYELERCRTPLKPRKRKRAEAKFLAKQAALKQDQFDLCEKRRLIYESIHRAVDTREYKAYDLEEWTVEERRIDSEITAEQIFLYEKRIFENFVDVWEGEKLGWDYWQELTR